MSDQTKIKDNSTPAPRKEYKVDPVKILSIPRLSTDWVLVAGYGDQYILTFGTRHDTMGAGEGLQDDLVEPQAVFTMSPSILDIFIQTAKKTMEQTEANLALIKEQG